MKTQHAPTTVRAGKGTARIPQLSRGHSQLDRGNCFGMVDANSLVRSIPARVCSRAPQQVHGSHSESCRATVEPCALAKVRNIKPH